MKEKTHLVTIAIVISSLINIGLNALLIPVMKITGAALASLIAYFIGNLFLLFFSEREMKISFGYWRMFLSFIITLAAIFLHLYIFGLQYKFSLLISLNLILWVISSTLVIEVIIGLNEVGRLLKKISSVLLLKK
jgi:peptidoglycan biosynthesis protein MviN/MurJ (putative lipid II flippase)